MFFRFDIPPRQPAPGIRHRASGVDLVVGSGYSGDICHHFAQRSLRWQGNRCRPHLRALRIIFVRSALTVAEGLQLTELIPVVQPGKRRCQPAQPA
jgi:hypothetical protein